MLAPISHQSIDATPTYWYTGNCPYSDELLKLPRTLGVERIATDLMRDLLPAERFNREGKMYGVLLVQTTAGEYGTIQAFSGLLDRKSVV